MGAPRMLGPSQQRMSVCTCTYVLLSVQERALKGSPLTKHLVLRACIHTALRAVFGKREMKFSGKTLFPPPHALPPLKYMPCVAFPEMKPVGELYSSQRTRRGRVTWGWVRVVLLPRGSRAPHHPPNQRRPAPGHLGRACSGPPARGPRSRPGQGLAPPRGSPRGPAPPRPPGSATPVSSARAPPDGRAAATHCPWRWPGRPGGACARVPRLRPLRPLATRSSRPRAGAAAGHVERGAPPPRRGSRPWAARDADVGRVAMATAVA